MITIAEPRDAQAIATLVNGAYRGESASRGWTHEAELLDGQRTDATTLRAAMEGGSTILLWREAEAAAPLGCVCVAPIEKDGPWSIGMLAVLPQKQATGLGGQILAAAEAYCRGRGACEVEMTVIGGRDSLIGWYERRAYRLTGSTRPFPYDDQGIGRPRRPDLRFLVLVKSL